MKGTRRVVVFLGLAIALLVPFSAAEELREDPSGRARNDDAPGQVKKVLTITSINVIVSGEEVFLEVTTNRKTSFSLNYTDFGVSDFPVYGTYHIVPLPFGPGEYEVEIRVYDKDDLIVQPYTLVVP